MVSKDDDYPPIANDDPLSTGLSGGNQIAKHVSRCLLIVVSVQVVVAVVLLLSLSSLWCQ
jgi:hypothetical protein